jgi:hypothetical protein
MRSWMPLSQWGRSCAVSRILNWATACCPITFYDKSYPGKDFRADDFGSPYREDHGSCRTCIKQVKAPHASQQR